MSAEQSLCTITFRTSGTCERASAASVSPPLSLIVSSSLSALSRPFLPPCRYCFFISSPSYSLALRPPHHCTFITLFHPALSVARRQKTCILLSFSPFVAPPCISTYIYNPSYFFFFIYPPPLPSPACGRLALSPSLCAAFPCHSFWLLSKHHPLPGRQQHQSLFAIQIVSFFFFFSLSPSFFMGLSPAVCTRCIFAA